MNATARIWIALPAVALLMVGLARAAEPWADPNLPVKDGLELWPDATRQNAARQTRRLRPLSDGSALDVWHDGSGRGHHLTQRIPEARPHFKTGAHGSAARFDGKDDFLSASNLGRTLTNATLFIFAAPRSNHGFFRAFLALNETGQNDYTTGLTIDLGPDGSGNFETLNPEGSGFGGAMDLMTGRVAFGTYHTITVTTESGPSGTRLFLDGAAQGRRSRAPSTLRMDEVTVGARCYSNSPEPPHTQGHLDGDIVEVLIYDRILTETERAQVEQYLAEKHAALKSAPPDLAGQALVTVTNPPPVQMFVPGFTVRALPVSLNNINNLKYRADGKLVALGYNGQVHLLTDTDGDGLEDKAVLFWDRPTLRGPIGMALTPPGYARGQGLFVAAKGKLALIVDTNADDRADQEIIVADGWKELPHGVDALGVALDREGNIFFGLGTADFTDAYLIDRPTGQSRYDLKSERGTILKVSPDFQKREIVCTGIRFSVALAFNSQGDLFCTDQEGATWLPNGNPFDELLHIQPGRHYGFPPRHPRHFPGVIDEPSVFDYAPQHQSTCGLAFNEPVNGGPAFGPPWWAGDAFVTGYSRGKLYRTKLVKTPAGYVAQNQLVACLNMLATDVCLSPQGDLLVATHSGEPDWGSGPTGPGKLYKIAYTGQEAPQPVLAWAAGPTQVHIAFDRALELASLKNLAQHVAITAGPYVQAGDRFESLRPGYQVVQNQLAAPRFPVPVLSANISHDRRTLILNIAPRTEALQYAVTLPGLGREEKADEARGALPQHPAVDLAYDLSGVEATWQPVAGPETWSGWLPHLDLAVARGFTKASGDHDFLWPRLQTPGLLSLRAQLDLWQMLRPAVQPGSRLDYELPPEQVTLEFAASVPFQVKTPAGQIEAAAGAPGQYQLTLSHQPKENQWLPLEVSLATGSGAPKLSVTWHTAEDPCPRALALRRILLPWATPGTEVAVAGVERQIPELAGGNWLRGQKLFFGDLATCSKCHQVRGQGGKIGPDLSNLIHRDYASVRKDILQPSAAINPDHIAYNVELKDGEMLTGVLENDSREQLVLADASGASVPVPKSRVAAIRSSLVSLMPEGLAQALDGTKMKDLLTFLLTSPLGPAPLEIQGEPPPRPRSEVEAVLKTLAPLPAQMKPLHIVLAAGPKDHGPGEHDYPLWQKRWATLLALAGQVKVSTAFGWPSSEQLATAHLIVFNSNNPGWSLERAAELDRFLERGGGLVFLHYAVDGHEHVEALSERIGLAWRGGFSKFRHGPLQLQFHPHPLAQGLGKLDFIDESYWNLVGDDKRIELLAGGVEEGAERPLFWTRRQGQGRVFVCILGHYTWTFDDPLFRLLVFRGMMWAAGEPMDRLSDLISVGARIGP